MNFQKAVGHFLNPRVIHGAYNIPAESGGLRKPPQPPSSEELSPADETHSWPKHRQDSLLTRLYPADCTASS